MDIKESSYSIFSFPSKNNRLFSSRLLIHINDSDIVNDNYLNELESPLSDTEFFKEFISNKENISFFITFPPSSTKELNRELEALSFNHSLANNKVKFATTQSFKYGKKGWICSLCNNFNFLNRKVCNRCEMVNLSFTDQASIPVCSEEKQKLEVRNGDWTCLKCKNFNFAFRLRCNRCNQCKQ